jgi:hypothetical protein
MRLYLYIPSYRRRVGTVDPLIPCLGRNRTPKVSREESSLNVYKDQSDSHEITLRCAPSSQETARLLCLP